MDTFDQKSEIQLSGDGLKFFIEALKHPDQIKAAVSSTIEALKPALSEMLQTQAAHGSALQAIKDMLPSFVSAPRVTHDDLRGMEFRLLQHVDARMDRLMHALQPSPAIAPQSMPASVAPLVLPPVGGAVDLAENVAPPAATSAPNSVAANSNEASVHSTEAPGTDDSNKSRSGLWLTAAVLTISLVVVTGVVYAWPIRH